MAAAGAGRGVDHTPPLLVALVSPREVVRRGLEAMLGGRGGIARVVSSGCDAEDVALADAVVYDLALLEVRGTGELKKLLTGSAFVLGFEVVGRPDLVQQALALGMSSSLPPDVNTAGLTDQLRRAARGHTISPERHRAGTHAEAMRRYGLTDREATILALIAGGMSNMEIADHLFLSINSIKTYIRHAYQRIGVRTRAEAVLWAVRHNLAEHSPRQDAERNA